MIGWGSKHACSKSLSRTSALSTSPEIPISDNAVSNYVGTSNAGPALFAELAEELLSFPPEVTISLEDV